MNPNGVLYTIGDGLLNVLGGAMLLAGALGWVFLLYLFFHNLFKNKTVRIDNPLAPLHPKRVETHPTDLVGLGCMALVALVLMALGRVLIWVL